MKFVSITKAKQDLSDMALQVAAGEEFTVTNRRVPIMKLVRADIPGHRPIGSDEGAFTVPDSFDDPIDWAAPQNSNL